MPEHSYRPALPHRSVAGIVKFYFCARLEIHFVVGGCVCKVVYYPYRFVAVKMPAYKARAMEGAG